MAEAVPDHVDIDEAVDERRGWRQSWHMPALMLGVGLLGAGLWLAMPDRQGNDFPAVLAEVAEHLAGGRFDQAAGRLDMVTEYLADADPDAVARHWALRGDLIYLQQRAQGGDVAANHRNVIDYYDQAEEGGLPLDAERLARYADTLVALQRDADALALLDRMTDQSPRVRCGLVRQIIERRQERGPVPAAELAGLLDTYETELRAETERARRMPGLVWAATVRARALIAGNDPRQAIDGLTRQIQRLSAEGGDLDLAPLYLALAQAHEMVGAPEEARRYYETTRRLLAPDDTVKSPLLADVLVGLARMDLADPERLTEALEQFRQVVSEFPGSTAVVPALLGQSDCEAKLGAHGAAIEHLGQAIGLLATQGDPEGLYGGEIERIVRSHHALNFDKQQYEVALDYVALLTPRYARGMPADMMLLFAATHEHLAQQRLDTTRADIDAEHSGGEARLSGDERALAFQDAAVHFDRAARYYRDHAQAITIADDAAHGRSLWKAADCYDKAQRWADAIGVYREFVKTRESDQRYLQAIKRLGLACLASRQYAAAAEQFKFLVEQKPQSQVAYESLVPLARCHVALGRHDQARHVLTSVVENHESIRPDSREYRNALVELAKLHHERGEFPDAIRRLRAAVDRYVRPDTAPAEAESAMLLFRLADALRRSVADLTLAPEQMPTAAAERALEQERTTRLTEAQSLFSEVIDRLEARDPDSLSDIEGLALRNAYFYRADCAYERARWEEAITQYDAAAKRWEKHPASLVALVQIVNARAEQGDVRAARIANDRARYQLSRIPDEAFDDPTLPMTRQHWQDWLRWTSELDLMSPQASAGVP